MTHTCPRRAENRMDRADGPFRGGGQDLDTYEAHRGLVGQPRGCSYCGSMAPDDFLEAVRAGAEVGPTDKSYKVYVHGLDRGGSPDDLRILGSTNGEPHGPYRAWSALSRAERRAVKAHSSYKDRKRWAWHVAPWGDAKVEGKFYFAHLSPEQGDEFIRMIDAGEVAFGYPGHFYRPISLPHTADGCARQCPAHRGEASS